MLCVCLIVIYVCVVTGIDKTGIIYIIVLLLCCLNGQLPLCTAGCRQAEVQREAVENIH